MIIVTEYNQGDEQWFVDRLASIGGSSIGKAVAKGEGKVRKSLLYDHVGELLSGQKKQHFVSKDIENGTLQEPVARDLYSFEKDVEVVQVALVKGDGKYTHYSPDGLVGDAGIIEIKTVIPSTFAEYIDTGSIATGYRKQMQWGLYICQREWCDYVVYCPYIQDATNLIIKRVSRDDKEISVLVSGARDFIAEMLAIYEKAKSL